MFILYHFFASNLTRILNAQKGIPQTANGKLQTAVCSPWETSILRCLLKNETAPDEAEVGGGGARADKNGMSTHGLLKPTRLALKHGEFPR